jgi:hypothetical protein
MNDINLDEKVLVTFCQKWRICEFALFGSALRKDFGPHSDVDILVEFEETADWDLFDVVDAKAELEGLFGRSVDFIEKDTVKNPLRRKNILESMKILYAKK